MKSSGVLLRVLGIVFGLSATVGGMVGQGILRTPGLVAQAIPSTTGILLTWLFGGVLASIGAFAYAELCSAIPSAGAEYTFAQRAFGRFAGTVVGWMGLSVYSIGIAVLATVSSEFLQRLGILTQYPASVPALLVLFLMLILNWGGTRAAGGIQILLTTLKGAILVGLILLLIVSQPGTAPPPPRAEEMSGLTLVGVIVALRMVGGTYDGWASVSSYGEEIKNPGKVIPRALFGGIAGVTVLYLLANLAFLHALNIEGLAGSSFAAGDALSVVLGKKAELALTIFAVISVMAVTHVNVMGGVRWTYALAREGDLPGFFSQVAPGGTPRQSLLLVCLLASAFIVSGTYETLIAAQVVTNMIIALSTNVAAWRLRKLEPDLERPFRIPFFPLPLILALSLNLALLTALVAEDPVHSLQGLAVIAVLLMIDLAKRAFGHRKQV